MARSRTPVAEEPHSVIEKAEPFTESTNSVDPGPSEQPAVDEVASAPIASSPTPNFTLGSWAGVEQYQCTKCAWDTVDGPEAFERHWVTHVTPISIPAPEQPRPLIFGPDGNPL